MAPVNHGEAHSWGIRPVAADDDEYIDDVTDSGFHLFDDPAPASLDNKYPDLAKCREKCNVGKDKSLFYSRVGKWQDKPTDFAKQEGLTLVREAYPSGFTEKNSHYTGFTGFAKRFSQAFAEKTSGVAWALLPTNSTDITKHVWAKIERPALEVANGACTRIIKVDPDDFSKRYILWDRDGKNSDDVSLENGPVPDPPSDSGATFEPGRCRVHVTQYQKNEANNPSPVYRLDLTIFDNADKVAGQNFGVDAPTGKYVGTTSLLPFVLLAAAGEEDDSAVLFRYGAQSWGSNDQEHECDFGGY
ncbi:MAG: hypothetical protein Q9184_001770 [Pyrenodesmia sp. 2 TL-2023]